MKHEPEYMPTTKHAVEEIRDQVAAAIVAGDRWLFVPGLDGFRALEQIRQRFYLGRPRSEFRDVVAPINKLGIFGFVLATKKRLSAGELARFLRSLDRESRLTTTPPTTDVLSKNSVVILAEREEGEMLMTNLKAWVDQSVQAEAELRRSGGRWN